MLFYVRVPHYVRSLEMWYVYTTYIPKCQEKIMASQKNIKMNFGLS